MYDVLNIFLSYIFFDYDDAMQDYKLIKSWRKTMSVSIKAGKIIVRAPYLTSKVSIDHFLHKHKNWIGKRLEKHKNIKILSSDEIKDLKIQARKYIPDRVALIAERF